MPLNEKGLGNSQTLCMELADLDFQVVESVEGHATVIRFRMNNESVLRGDTLLVLQGPDIRFHGLISALDQGWAVATDRRGSTIPA